MISEEKQASIDWYPTVLVRRLEEAAKTLTDLTGGSQQASLLTEAARTIDALAVRMADAQSGCRAAENLVDILETIQPGIISRALTENSDKIVKHTKQFKLALDGKERAR